MANTEAGALSHTGLLECAAIIVTSYVANNRVPAADLPSLLPAIYDTLAALGTTGSEAKAESEVARPTPAQIRKSITQDALISFIDGKPYKILKRHLGVYGLNPHAYRERYGLPADYPMTAPGYSAMRSALAKETGLGRFGGRAERQAAK